MQLRTFFVYGIIVAILEYGTLLFAGYYLGASFGGSFVKILENAQYVIAFAALVLTGYYVVSWKMRGKFLKADKEVEDMPV